MASIHLWLINFRVKSFKEWNNGLGYDDYIFTMGNVGGPNSKRRVSSVGPLAILRFII